MEHTIEEWHTILDGLGALERPLEHVEAVNLVTKYYTTDGWELFGRLLDALECAGWSYSIGYDAGERIPTRYTCLLTRSGLSRLIGGTGYTLRLALHSALYNAFCTGKEENA